MRQNNIGQPNQNNNIPPAIYVPPIFQWPIGYGPTWQRQNNQKAKQKMFTQINKQNKQLFDNYHPYGNVFFTNEITKKQIIHLFSYNIIGCLSWSNWNIEIKNFDDFQLWLKRFQLIIESQHNAITVQVDQQKVVFSEILQCLQPIEFYDLKSLSLYACGIQNIESLAYLNSPKLQKINLIYNHVFQYKGLNKVTFKLKQLFIYSRNPKVPIQIDMGAGIQLDNFSRWNFRLKDFRLQKYEQNSVIMNDLSFLAKTKYDKKIQSMKIGISRKGRIKQRNLLTFYSMTQIAKFQIWQNIDMFHGQLPPDFNPEDQHLYQLRM